MSFDIWTRLRRIVIAFAFARMPDMDLDPYFLSTALAFDGKKSGLEIKPVHIL